MLQKFSQPKSRAAFCVSPGFDFPISVLLRKSAAKKFFPFRI